jgi:hypothetical protein
VAAAFFLVCVYMGTVCLWRISRVILTAVYWYPYYHARCLRAPPVAALRLLSTVYSGRPSVSGHAHYMFIRALRRVMSIIIYLFTRSITCVCGDVPLPEVAEDAS